jgi:hypothetical protein
VELLGENARVLWNAGGSGATTVNEWAAQIVKDAEKEGFDILSIKEQLYAVGWPRPPAGS